MDNNSIMKFKKVLDTRSDMWCVWNPEIGKGINSYDEWEDKFYEDINLIEFIKKQLFVPININRSGSFEFSVRINDSNNLTPREKNCFIISSNNYLIKSDGKLYISGIEYIEETVNDIHVLEIKSNTGIYNIRIDLIDWKKETENINLDGTSKENALSDFLIHINLSNENNDGCSSLNTFNKK